MPSTDQPQSAARVHRISCPNVSCYIKSMTIAENLASKRDHLLAQLRNMGSVAVAFSGGIDHTVVAQAAFLAPGEPAVGATADTPNGPRPRIAEPGELATHIGRLHVILQNNE